MLVISPVQMPSRWNIFVHILTTRDELFVLLLPSSWLSPKSFFLISFTRKCRAAITVRWTVFHTRELMKNPLKHAIFKNLCVHEYDDDDDDDAESILFKSSYEYLKILADREFYLKFEIQLWLERTMMRSSSWLHASHWL